MIGLESGGLRIAQRRDEPDSWGAGASLPKKPLFEMGQQLITPEAEAALDHQDVVKALARHQSGDWGDVEPEDCYTNQRALRIGAPLFSAYQDSKGIKFWITTEADRATTTIMLPIDQGKPM